MSKMLKIVLMVVGIILSIGVWQPLIFEVTDWGLNWLNTHNLGHRWLLYGLSFVAAFIAGGIIGGFKDMFNNHASETVQGETRYNPAWGWALVALVINIVIALIME